MDGEEAIGAPGERMLLRDVVSTLAAVEKTIHQLEATRTALLAVAHRIAEEDTGDLTDLASREMAHRAVATEIGAALRVPDRTIEAQMGEAQKLVDDFPATAAAFGEGWISRAHVRLIVTLGEPIETADGRAAFEQQVLARAERESVNRVRPYAKQIAERVRNVSFQQRHDEARKQRQAWVTDEEDGESTLHVRGASVVIHGIHDRLSQMAYALRAENDRVDEAGDLDDRTVGQLRSDLAADLLLTGAPEAHSTSEVLLASIQAIVEITIPITTVIDPLDEAPAGHLAGIGPIDPETARILARNAPGWDRVMTDPVSGALLATDRYRPTADLRRHLRSRDRRCRFMGCNLTPRKTDDDHDIDYALGGTTEEQNLSGKCRRHHVAKHHTPWSVEHEHGAVLRWTSPTGRVYVDRPPGVPGHVTFEDIRRRIDDGAPWRSGDTAGAPF